MRLFPSPSETIAATAQDIAAGRRTCVDVLKSCLAQIEEREASVRAWVIIDRDGALKQARAMDAELAAGEWHGPLHGIPIGIKDIIDVEAMPTAAGAPVPADVPGGPPIARADAPIVAQLRQAGAVILGKTVTTPFASFDPSITRNPWNLERTPGGSSSGSAAAVACGMCLGAIGSQTGGSITRPASYCGIAGCKPTYGLLQVGGILPLAPSMDHPGPIARTVRDLATLLDAMGPVSCLPWDVSLSGDSETAPRLGRLHGLFDELAEPVMREAFEGALKQLANSGAVIQEPALPGAFADVIPRHRVVMAVEAAAYHESRFKEHPGYYPPRISDLIREGLATSATEYARCRQHQANLSKEILSCLSNVDALITPATTGPAPEASTTGDPAFNSPWSYTGLPTISFPIGMSTDGMPLAIQLVGRPQQEAGLFQVAVWCEDVIRRRYSEGH